MEKEGELILDNKIEFEKVEKQMKPFDIIAFLGADLISNIISGVQKYYLGTDQISHIGMVVTSEILPFFTVNDKKIGLDTDEIYVLESTIPYDISLNLEVVPDIFTGTGEMGVQIRKLKDVISFYTKDGKSSVGWCKLINNPFENSKDNLHPEEHQLRKYLLSTKFQTVFNKYYGRMYDASFISLGSAIFPKMRKIRTIRDFIYYKFYQIFKYFGLIDEHNLGPLGWQFCSELIANIYIEIGIINPTIDPKNVTPADFFGFDQDGLPLLVEIPVYLIVPSSPPK